MRYRLSGEGSIIFGDGVRFRCCGTLSTILRIYRPIHTKFLEEPPVLMDHQFPHQFLEFTALSGRVCYA